KHRGCETHFLRRASGRIRQQYSALDIPDHERADYTATPCFADVTQAWTSQPQGNPRGLARDQAARSGGSIQGLAPSRPRSLQVRARISETLEFHPLIEGYRHD